MINPHLIILLNCFFFAIIVPTKPLGGCKLEYFQGMNALMGKKAQYVIVNVFNSILYAAGTVEIKQIVEY